MIYTSYYGNAYIPTNMLRVGISTGMPYKLDNIRELNPGWELINYYKSTGDKVGYVRIYKEQVLGKLKPIDIINKIRKLSVENGFKEVVLLCYERPNDFCHRHLVAEWLREAGYNIEEYKGRY